MWCCSCGGDSIVIPVMVTVEVGRTMAVMAGVMMVMGVLGVNRMVMVDMVVMGVEVRVVMVLMIGMVVVKAEVGDLV